MKLHPRSTSWLIVALAAGTTLLVSPTEAEVQDAAPVREVRVEADRAYRPARITLSAGERVRLAFVRHDDGPCTREVVSPALGLRGELPAGRPVAIALPALQPNEYEFRCGMNMVRGTLVVAAR